MSILCCSFSSSENSGSILVLLHCRTSLSCFSLIWSGVSFNLRMMKRHEQKGRWGMVCLRSYEQGKWWRGRGVGGREKNTNRTTKRLLLLFCCIFWPIATICFVLVFCIIRCIHWNFRPAKPYIPSVFYRMLQGENNDFPPKKGVYRKTMIFCNMLRF